MKNTAIAIFVKTPGCSPIKEGLADSIGPEAAMEFYHICLAIKQQVAREMDADIFWAVDEEEGASSYFWRSFQAIYAGDGDRGDKLHHVYSTLIKDYDRVLMIDADTPQVSQPHLTRAISSLSSHEFVMTPARSGGFCLFGGRSVLPRSVWTSLPSYDSADMLSKFVGMMPSKPRLTSPLTTIDDGEDLKNLLLEMPPLRTTAQDQLVNWIDMVLGRGTFSAPGAPKKFGT